MKFKVIFSLIVLISSSVILWELFDIEEEFDLYLDKSGPFVGTETPILQGINGDEIRTIRDKINLKLKINE